MPPVGAPTMSFSAWRAAVTSSGRDSPRSSRSSTAAATEQVSAAEDDSPAPGGTSLSTSTASPAAPSGHSVRPRSAHTAPAA